jgi:hypothetical protein
MTRSAHPRARARLAVAATFAALAVALAGCAQSSNTTSTTGAVGAAPPTSSAPTTSTPPTASTPTTATTTTSATTPGVGPASGPLTATPASGSPQSVIHFAFVAPDTGTAQGHNEVSATLSVMGPQKTGCIGIHEQPLPALAAGRQATVSVGPAQLGGDWCPGTYTARVEVLARPKCGPGMMCPQFIRVVASFGPARFRISG